MTVTHMTTVVSVIRPAMKLWTTLPIAPSRAKPLRMARAHAMWILAAAIIAPAALVGVWRGMMSNRETM